MTGFQSPNVENDFYQAHVKRLLASYQRWLNRPLLIADGNSSSLAQQVFEADFALLSHTADQDPVFNYANRQALKLFEFSWAELMGMPSRYSAELISRQAREALLAKVSANGYISDYSGVRITKNGKRFLIEGAVVWNVMDESNHYIGQAACFEKWRPVT